MRQRRNGFGLAREALAPIGIRGGEDLDRNRPVETGIPSLVDLSHSARANSAEDFVRTETGSIQEGHRLSGDAPILP